MKKIISVVLCLVLIICLTACSGDSGNALTMRVLMNIKPVNIDPQLAESTEELVVARNCFEGLFRYDGNKAVPAACDDYTVTDDGLEWTFSLRNGLKWSDGVNVTADDFVFGIKRSIMPDTAAANAKMLAHIKGATAALNGLAAIDSVGIYAEDNQTVVIKLEQRVDDLPEILSRAMCMPCRKDIFEKAKGRYGMSEKLVVCNGPYTLSGIGDTSLRISANEHYTGKFTNEYNQVTFSYGATESERITSLSNRLADIAFISSGSANEANAAGLNISVFKNTAWIIAVNSNKEILGENSVSSAIKACLDSNAYSDVLPFSFSAFGGVIADDLQVNGKRYIELTGGRTPLYGSDGANAALISALEKHKGKLEAVSLVYPDGYELKQTAARIAQFWQQQLGIVVNITSADSVALLNNVKSGAFEMALIPITSDDGFALSALNNLANLKLCELPDVADPISAEQIILDDSHIIPLAQSGRCIAMSKKADSISFDLFEGAVAFYATGVQ